MGGVCRMTNEETIKIFKEIREEVIAKETESEDKE